MDTVRQVPPPVEAGEVSDERRVQHPLGGGGGVKELVPGIQLPPLTETNGALASVGIRQAT